MNSYTLVGNRRQTSITALLTLNVTRTPDTREQCTQFIDVFFAARTRPSRIPSESDGIRQPNRNAPPVQQTQATFFYRIKRVTEEQERLTPSFYYLSAPYTNHKGTLKPMSYNKEQLKQIKKYVTKDSPLGPVDAQVILDDFVSGELFYDANEVYKNETERPSIIVGRKGSGKTALLKSQIRSCSYPISINIDAAQAFGQIIDSVNEAHQKEEGYIVVEQIKKFWEFLFWGTLTSEINKRYNNEFSKDQEIKKLLSFARIRGHESPAGTIIKLIRSIAKKAHKTSIGILSDIISDTLDEFGLEPEDLRSIVTSTLSEKGEAAIIVIDSLDDYHLDADVVRKSISGLLACVGQFNAREGWPEMRLFLPSELYYTFEDLSVNPLKDFSARLVIHWHSGELLALLARRLRIHIYVFWPNDASMLTAFNVFKKKDARKFIRHIFPSSITNKAGFEEVPEAYILRHTQLLPRQLIYIMTEILKRNQIINDTKKFELHAQSIREGVENAEENLWKEVCAAYKDRYPKAKDVCAEIIPHLPLTFSDGKLHEIFNQHGKRVYQDKSVSYHHFRRMLIEIGCIGVVLKGIKSEKYIHGLFEYAMPGSLNPGNSDELCLHPMFCGGVKTEQSKAYGVKKVIYPYGADPEIEDYREAAKREFYDIEV